MGMAGAGAALIGTSAFTSVSSDRGANLSTVDDANALLGIDGYADPGTVPTFTNNNSSSIDVTLDSSEDVEFDVQNNGLFELVPVTFTLSAGESVDVAIQDGGNAGSDSDINIIANSGDSVIEATRNFAIPASSAVKDIEPSVNAAGGSGKYEFELENKGSTTVTLTEIGVVQTTNNNVTKVGGKNNDAIFNNVTSGNSIVNNPITIGGSRQPLTTNVNLNPGPNNSITFEFDRFRDSQNNNGNMSGEDVRIEVAFSDGSSTTLDLCINGCSFTSTPTPTPGGTPIPNQPPTADFTSTRKGKNAELDASTSSDPDGSISSYEWDVNANGVIDYTGVTIKEKIPSGTTVKLIVTDNDGATGSVTKNINSTPT